MSSSSDIIDTQHPPKFDGSNFGIYRQKVNFWTNYTDIAKSKQGGLLLLNCIGRANDIIHSVDESELAKESGVQYFLSVLESVYGEQSNTRELIALFDEYRKLSRGTDSCSVYVSNFLKLSSKLSRRINPKMVDCLQLITGANMSEDTMSQFLTIFVSNNSPWDVEKVATILKQVLPSVSMPSESVPTPSVLHVSNTASQSQKNVSHVRVKGYGRSRSGYGSKGKGKSSTKNSNYYSGNSYYQSYKGSFPPNYSKSSGKGKSYDSRYIHHVSDYPSHLEQFPTSRTGPTGPSYAPQYDMPSHSSFSNYSDLPMSPVFY